MKNLLSLLFLTVTVLCGGAAFAQTSRTWTGSTSTAWGTASNWSPSGVPAAIDHVTIPNTTNKPVLSSNVTVANFSITGGELDLDGDTLTVNGTLSMTGGVVKDGLVKKTSTSTITITGVTVECGLDISGHAIGINTSRFKEPVKVTKTGGSVSAFYGNVWEAATDMTNTATAGIIIGSTQSDTVLADLKLTRVSNNIDLGSHSMAAAVVFAGTDDQYLELSGTNITGRRIIINKPSGAMRVEGDITVQNFLTLTKGIVHINVGSVFTIAGTATVSGASHDSYIEGAVRQTTGGTFIFPVGRNGFYRPIAMSGASAKAASYRAEYFPSNSAWTYSHSNKQSPLVNISREEYWVLERLSGSENVTVTLSWNDQTSCSVDVLSDLRVTAWGGSEWKNLGNGGMTGNSTEGSVSASSASGYYSFYTIAAVDTLYCDCLPSMADAGGDRDIPFGDDVTLGPEVTYPNLDYSWSPSTYLDDDEIANPLCEPLAPVKYYLTVDDGICALTDSAIVRPVAEFCGAFPSHTALPPDTNFIMGGIIDPIVFDRFGNSYNISDITHGSCTPGWTTEDEVLAGYFSLSFCTDGITPNPFTTQVKNTIAQVFEDMSDLIIPQVCGTTPATVNIQITAPVEGIGGALGAASQFYIPEWELCTVLGQENSGIINGQVWQAINTGVNEPDLMDAQIALNFADFTFNADHTQATGAGEYDLYTVMLHEIIHTLGFASFMRENGQSWTFPQGFNFYPRFSTHLEGNGTPVLNWGLGNLYNATLNGAAPLTGCNMRFEGAYSSADISSWAEGRFSHFSEACNPGTQRVMLPGLAPATDHRAVSDDDVNVLLDLGYEVSGTFPMNLSATPSGGPGIIGYRDGLSTAVPDCATRITMELCPDPDDHVTITLADLITNDINATDVARFELVQGSGTLSVSSTDEWEYYPNSTGIHVLRYVPVNNPTTIDITTVGNSTCVTVEVMPCDPLGDCHEPDACNMICNPDFDYPLLSEACNHGMQFGVGLVPSWQASHGTPDWMECPGASPPNPGYVWMFANANMGCQFGSEGIFTRVDIEQGKSYTLSYYRRRGGLYNSTPMDHFFVHLLWSGSSTNIPQFSSCEPAVSASQLIVEETNITDMTWEQVTVCFTADDDYDRIWFYPRNATSQSTVDFMLDRVVLVEDTYSAGTDRNIVCGNTTLGEIACEADNATYSWTVLGDTEVLGTGQQLLVNANATTTYQVTRAYPANPATVAFPTTADNCTLVDDVTVTVTAPIILTTDFTDATCGNCDGTAEVTGITNGTSPFLYLWEDDEEESVSITDEAEDLCPGTYTLYVTDDDGCVAVEEVIISTTPSVSLTFDSEVSTCGNCDGTAEVTGMVNGTPPYTYLWQDVNEQTVSTAIDAEDLCYGTYTVTVTDDNECVAVDEVVIGVEEGCDCEEMGITFIATVSANAAVCTGSTASATVDVSLGLYPPYTYLWNDPLAQTAATATGLDVGETYIVTVTDDLECSQDIQVEMICADFKYWDCFMFLDCAVFDNNPAVEYFGVRVVQYGSTNSTCSYGGGTPVTYDNAGAGFDPSAVDCSGWWDGYKSDVTETTLISLYDHMNMDDDPEIVPETSISVAGTDYGFQLLVKTGSVWSTLGSEDCILTGPIAPCTSYAADKLDGSATDPDEEVQQEESISFELFPNPATNEVSIRVRGASGNMLIALTDVLGRRVMHHQAMPDDQGTVQLDIESLTSGVYMCSLHVHGQAAVVRRLVVNGR